jgi:hypothetical protein
MFAMYVYIMLFVITQRVLWYDEKVCYNLTGICSLDIFLNWGARVNSHCLVSAYFFSRLCALILLVGPAANSDHLF